MCCYAFYSMFVRSCSEVLFDMFLANHFVESGKNSVLERLIWSLFNPDGFLKSKTLLVSYSILQLFCISFVFLQPSRSLSFFSYSPHVLEHPGRVYRWRELPDQCESLKLQGAFPSTQSQASLVSKVTS